MEVLNIPFTQSSRAGDTILSVTWKKSCYIFRKALDPDSYDISTMRDLKKKAQLYDTYIFVSLFVVRGN